MGNLWNSDDQRKHDLFNGPQRDPTASAARHGYAYTSRRRTAVGGALMPDDFMPVGPHAGKHLRAIPPSYFTWVQQQGWSRQWRDWQPVADFLSRHPQFLLPLTPETVLPRVNLYVDALRPCLSTNGWPWTARAHLYALPGDLDWLHTFATGALGLRRAWFVAGSAQQPLPHYPLSPSKHPQALTHNLVSLVDAARFRFDTGRWQTEIPLARQDAAAEADADPDSPDALPTFTGRDCPASRPRRVTPFDRINPKSQKWCPTTKPQYTKKEAQTLLNQRMNRSNERNRPDFLRIYECPSCKAWHLTRRRVDR